MLRAARNRHHGRAARPTSRGARGAIVAASWHRENYWNTRGKTLPSCPCMPHRRTLFLFAILPPLVWTACASQPAASSGPAMPAASLDDVSDLMVDRIDRPFTEVLLREIQRDLDQIDLAQVQRAAESMAAAMAELHGPLQLPTIPQFAQLARDAESELRELAKDAAAGRRVQVQQRVLRLESRHCDRCHTAAEHAGR